jgi:hypothetical protein
MRDVDRYAGPLMRRMSTIAPLIPLILGLCLTWTAACAIGERENRRVLNALDARAAPATVGGRWALSPVALPAGLVAALADMLVVHPATVFDDAWRDTVDLLWTSREESRFRRALFVPLAALATPFVYVGDWLGRAVLAIPPHDADEADEDEPAGGPDEGHAEEPDEGHDEAHDEPAGGGGAP